MHNNLIPSLIPGDMPVPLTPAEQKQIRDAMCAAAARGLRYVSELGDIRVGLSREFAQMKSDSLKSSKAKV